MNELGRETFELSAAIKKPCLPRPLVRRHSPLTVDDPIATLSSRRESCEQFMDLWDCFLQRQLIRATPAPSTPDSDLCTMEGLDEDPTLIAGSVRPFFADLQHYLAFVSQPKLEAVHSDGPPSTVSMPDRR